MSKKKSLLGMIALLTIIAAPAAYFWDFIPASLESTGPGYPIDILMGLKSSLFLMATVMGGGTMLFVIYVAVFHSEWFRDKAAPMVPGWKNEGFAAWMILVTALIFVAIMLTAAAMSAIADPGDFGEDEDVYEVTAQGVHPGPGADGGGWVFTAHATGGNELIVPKDTRVEIDLQSGDDRLHTFAIQDLGVKKHMYPGDRATDTWFVAEETGEYDIVCTELCGPNHNNMYATLTVMEEDEFIAEHGDWRGGDE